MTPVRRRVRSIAPDVTLAVRMAAGPAVPCDVAGRFFCEMITAITTAARTQRINRIQILRLLGFLGRGCTISGRKMGGEGATAGTGKPLITGLLR